MKYLFIIFTLLIADPATAQDLQQHFDQVETFVSNNCLDCHSGADPSAGFDLEDLDFSRDTFSKSGLDTSVWEKLHRRTHTRQMPPPESERPAEADYARFVTALESILANHDIQFPRLGRIGELRRLTRTEYQNAIRDLLGIEIDASEYIPRDESSHGFDNITVEDLSTTRMSRYISAAQKISRVAIGRVSAGGNSRTIRLPADRSQEEHVAGLPFGTRGGAMFKHHFPKTGEYEFSIRLTRDRDEKVEGLNRKHNIDLLVDRKREHRFEVVPPPNDNGKWDERDFTHSDTHLNIRVNIEAGEHAVGVTFPKTSSSLVENKRQPFQANFNRHRHPRKTPAIYQVSIVGPFKSGPIELTPSRARIFGSVDTSSGNEESARQIISNLTRIAYRRPIEDADLQQPMDFFKESFRQSGFDAGMEAALAAILSNPNFLFKVEVPRKKGIAPLSDVELASRLAFFLWSSIPDDELLQLAEQGKLTEDTVLAAQVDRMLADPRSESLVSNFAGQWLYLRNLESITPDLRLFPDFDDNLRQSFRGETENLFREIIQSDQSVLKLIKPDHAWLNQRLADHYGIGSVQGGHFRKVTVDAESRRGGILRHGSILMVTSYATRTSPTIRGNWVLENIFGTPAPPPPPNIPNLKENKRLESTSLRQRLAQHRADPACAGCHNLMDPVGFSLENFDAVGRWREFSASLPIDSDGSLPDGTDIKNVDDLEQGILKRPAVFVQTMTEKLMTFALGRVVESFDGPTVRKVVDQASQAEFRFSSIVKGIVLSKPFRYRED